MSGWSSSLPRRRSTRAFGRKLLTAAEEWCTDHSIGLLKLHVFAHNTAAVSLYESAGFEATNINMAKRIR